MSSQSPEALFNAVLWRSRRGLLELDLLLQPFVRSRYADLSTAEQESFRRLLYREDTDLLAWFKRREIPSDPDIVHIVEMVLAHARADTS